MKSKNTEYGTDSYGNNLLHHRDLGKYTYLADRMDTFNICQKNLLAKESIRPEIGKEKEKFFFSFELFFAYKRDGISETAEIQTY